MQGSPHGANLSTLVVGGRRLLVEEKDKSSSLSEGEGIKGLFGWVVGGGCSVGDSSGKRICGSIIVNPCLHPEEFSMLALDVAV